MSIFFEFHVGPSGRRFRRAVDGDKADIELFIDSEHTEKIFQRVDIGSLIELSTLSICMINEDKEVLGFMALNDYPNVDAVDPADWELWIRNMYQRFYLSRNTLFIHFMCCKDSATEYFLEEALVSVFNNDVYLSQIVLLVSPECQHENLSYYNVFKRRNMNKYPARRDEDDDRFHYLYAALRQDHCPKMKIRRAVEEDNDDICDILDKRSPRLKEIYGDYYISEILAYDQESNRKIIVAEHQERAVGVMCLSPSINYKKLQSTYETRPYYGLRKATPLEKEQLKRSNKLLSTFGDPVMSGKLCPFYKLGVEEDKNILNSDVSKENISLENTSTKDKTKINFKRKVSINNPRERESSGFQNKTDFHYSEDYSELMRSQSSLLTDTTNLLDADDCDYDIVNIDVSVLNVLPDLSVDYPDSQENYYGQSHQSNFTRRIKRRSMMKPADSDTYNYNGEPNAFMIELFGLHEDLHERRGFDLLEAAFEIMKNLDYCIIRVPSADTCFPLLQHFCLVPTKPRICCTYSLYIAHRSSVLGRLRVREAEFIDIPLISRLFQNIQGKETIWMVEHCIYNVEKRKHQAYVFMSGLSIVGIGIVEPPEKLKLLRAKFNLDTYHNHKYHQVGCGSKVGFSAVVSVLTYPVFETHYRFFAREIMRLSGSNSLVWMTAYRSKWVAHKANCIVSSMVPVLPRKCDFDFSDVPELMKLSSMSQNIMAFCTWFLDKKLTTVPIVSVGTKIVVLGASRTSMAFLNTLLFGRRLESTAPIVSDDGGNKNTFPVNPMELISNDLDILDTRKDTNPDETNLYQLHNIELDSSTYLSFTNVTMISPNGLPYMRSYNPAAEMMFPKFHNNTDKYLKSVPYTYYVNIVQGTMTEINKADRYISLTNGGRYYYDFLFLLIGKQYQHPHYLKKLYERDMRKETYVSLDMPRESFEPEVMSNETPDNVFIINNISEANKALKYVRNYHNEYHDSQIIVYGATIDTYCCLAALMELNVSASNIIFVEPFPPEDPYKPRVSVFYNSYVDETVAHVLDNLGIKVYRGYYFQMWRVLDDYVTHVEFLTDAQVVTFECTAFFYYGKRGVNAEAFFAVNKAGIAYDAGILIDHEFRTKDPHIYAAGPATAYYSRYHSPTMKQKYYDSYDIGEKLGTLIKNTLDPLFSNRQKPARSSSLTSYKPGLKSVTILDPSTSSLNDGYNEKLPDLQKPKVIYCRLPGGLQYLEVRSPGKKIPHYYLQSLHHSGFVMETFKGGYFKIHLTSDLIVDGITCLTPLKFSVECFQNLHGRSSVCLNNVFMRYSTKRLDDFYEFFRSPWALYLYHDQAGELFAMVKELLPKGEHKGDTIRDAMRKLCVNLPTSKNTRTELRNKFEASPHLESITDYVIEWISENEILLPMYIQPSIKTLYSHDVDRNPMFRKKKISITQLMTHIY